MANNQPIRIILVDDHQLMRETWKMVLESDGKIVVIAECASGADAIDTVLKLNPDVVLMDINMSPVNGFEATRDILKQNPQIKIIGVSINDQPAYVQNMLQLGAKGYVTKNSAREEMVKAITEVHQGRTYLCKEVEKKLDGDAVY